MKERFMQSQATLFAWAAQAVAQNTLDWLKTALPPRR